MKIILRARLRPIEEWPEWARCCERIVQVTLPLIELRVTSKVFMAGPVICGYCGKMTPGPQKSMQVVDEHNNPLPQNIFVDLFDLDEGIAA